MKNRITLFITCLLCYNLSAQIPFKDLDIKQFQYADAKIRTFDVGFFQDGQSLKTNYGGDFNNGISSKYFQFNGSFSNYVFKNTRKLQHSSSLSGNVNTSKSTTTQDDRPWLLATNIGWNAQSRHYKDKSYVEINPEVNFQYRKNENLLLNAGIALKKGIGRIEPVTDVFMTRWMLKEIEEGGTDISNLTQEDVFAIANRLNVINNYRIFDNRRQLKSQIKDITLALNDKVNGITDQLDLYGIVFDNYTRAFVGNRFEGSRKALAVRPFVASNTRYIQNQENFTRTGMGVEFYGEYIKSRNTSLNAQQSLEFQLGTGYNSNSFDNGMDIIYPFANGKYQFDYFPSSRTTLSYFVEGSYRYVNYSLSDDIIKRPSLGILNARTGLSTSYFINFRTRIQANFSVSYFNQNIMNTINTDQNQLNFSNNISFLHSIF
ncbi:MAG TPA: hypothetical protein PLY70_10890 [Saprospiraceae bacterium]|nr:hypothetical protein [Saprospiraceae bacterium]HPN70643.1 hypothetical protein [Saprospiraceae bacterium]